MILEKMGYHAGCYEENMIVNDPSLETPEHGIPKTIINRAGRVFQKPQQVPPGMIEISPPEADFQPRNLFFGNDKIKGTIVP